MREEGGHEGGHEGGRDSEKARERESARASLFARSESQFARRARWIMHSQAISVLFSETLNISCNSETTSFQYNKILKIKRILARMRTSRLCSRLPELCSIQAEALFPSDLKGDLKLLLHAIPAARRLGRS